MKEHYISFETAKTLKEKGFVFDTDTETHDFCPYNQDGNLVSSVTDEIIHGITQNLLQKILREVHNIDVQPYLIELESNGRQLTQDVDQKEYTYSLCHRGISQWVDSFNDLSYEEALEVGLRQGLKLI